MKVLIACEESQRVCIAFRKRGHEAYSCDIQEPSGGHPEWHILGDALKAIEGGRITTMDGKMHDIGRWDLLIAHPPCTHLAVSGMRWFKNGVKPLSLKYEAAAFFLKFAEADVEKIAIENPICDEFVVSQARSNCQSLAIRPSRTEKDGVVAEKSPPVARDGKCL